MRQIDSTVRNIVSALRRKFELYSRVKLTADIVIYTCQIECPKMTEEEVKTVTGELGKRGITAVVVKHKDNDGKVYWGWQFEKANVRRYLNLHRLS